MPIEIRHAPASAREHIEKMMSPYLADLGAPPGMVYPRLDAYWYETGRYPYIIVHAEEPVGFMLVHQINEKSEFELVEFYIAPRFRRRAFGRLAAAAVFNLHAGKWFVRVRRDNAKALTFWDRVFAKDPSVAVADVTNPDGIVYNFSSRHNDT